MSVFTRNVVTTIETVTTHGRSSISTYATRNHVCQSFQMWNIPILSRPCRSSIKPVTSIDMIRPSNCRHLTNSALVQAPPKDIKDHGNSNQNSNNPNSVQNIRNIGIIAHIDAGKTTTTERMLYYVGFIDSIGEVHDGSTVTDYLRPERERGITITSACIPMLWQSRRLNLIDTPGHVDFTMEVERSMRVLDGAVCLLDAVAGVEAQTETVWNQANRYGVSRIAYINKMDREGASCRRSFQEMKTRLRGGGIPVLVSWPVVIDGTEHVLGKGSGGPGFQGIIDLLTMEYVDFSTDATGSAVQRLPLEDAIKDPKSLLYHKINHKVAKVDHLVNEAKEYRDLLVEQAAELDEELLEKVISVDMDYSKIEVDELIKSIRKLTISGQLIPVFCGSSYKNIGVQPLLDAVVNYLPSPKDVNTLTKGTVMDLKTLYEQRETDNEAEVESENNMYNTTGDSSLQHSRDGNSEIEIIPDPNGPLRAMAFKIIKDPKRGVLVFIRIYSGLLRRGDKLFNVNKAINERVMKVFEMYAEDYEELPFAGCGNVVAVSGLKFTATGDTIMHPPTKDIPIVKLDTIRIPPPVFMTAVVPKSQSESSNLQDALALLSREDPSIRVHESHESGQLIVSGMGELHLEIVQDRLKESYGMSCTFGSIQIAYRETPSRTPPTIEMTRVLKSVEPCTYRYKLDKEILGVPFKVEFTLELFSLADSSEDGEFILVKPDSSRKTFIEALDAADKYDLIEMKKRLGLKLGNTNTAYDQILNANKNREQRKLPLSVFYTINGDGEPTRYTPTDVELQLFSKAASDSIRNTLMRGPLAGYPLLNLGIRIVNLVIVKGGGGSNEIATTPSALRTGIQKAVKEAIDEKLGGSRLMEPYMTAQISIRERYVGVVTRDITKGRMGQILAIRGGNIEDDDFDDTLSQNEEISSTNSSITETNDYVSDRRVVIATIPLSKLMGYSTVLRTLTQGEGSFTMELHGYKMIPMSSTQAVLKDLRKI